ncbi:MAG: carboxylating nicotinate-nucleotide diphosphorylase [bacterium]
MTDIQRQLIIQALAEDSTGRDATTLATVDRNEMGRAYFLAKAQGILSGIDIATEVFSIYATRSNRESKIITQHLVRDGSAVKHGDRIAEVHAPLDIILTAERVALNLLQRMSGIATLTNKYVRAVSGTNAKILDTRKTAPLLRPFDRQAVLSGGGKNHRYSLAEMILVKDNHIAANGGDIIAVLEKLRSYFKTHPLIPVEIEVTSTHQLQIVLEHGRRLVNRVLLDNFLVADLHEAVKVNARAFETEASGGVNLTTVRAIAETGVDYISVGALTHSVTGLDISLEVE